MGLGIIYDELHWFGLAFLAVISAVLVSGMILAGIMDLPGGRKAHARPTPKAGGVGVIGACMSACLLFAPMREGWLLASLLSACGLGLVGLLDDIYDLKALPKFLSQVLAALPVVWLAPIGLEGKLLALAWLVGVTNVVNFMDGLDTLAAGTGLVAATIMAFAAPAGGATQFMALALAAGLAGFVPFNLPPARIFLGDTGSQFCGFLLALLGLRMALDEGVARGGWLPAMLLFGMLFDGVFTLFRRAWSGAALLIAHREHIYQRMRLPPWQISLAHAGFAISGGVAWFLAPQLGVSGAFFMVAGPQALWLILARYRARVPRYGEGPDDHVWRCRGRCRWLDGSPPA